MVENDQSVWVGANDIDQEFDFVWIDGSPMIYNDFNEGQPDNDLGLEHCVEVRLQFKNFIFIRFIYQELLLIPIILSFLSCQTLKFEKALEQANFTCSLLFEQIKILIAKHLFTAKTGCFCYPPFFDNS